MEEIPLHSRETENSAVGRLLRGSLFAAVLLAMVLLVLLATATSNTELFQGSYQLLFWLTAIVGTSLVVLVLEMTRRLLSRYRRGVFGARLMARMALSFTVMTIVPLLLIYIVAVQFVGRSIESWFDVPLERALDSGLNLGRATLDAMRSDVSGTARAMAAELADTPRDNWSFALQRMREQHGLQDVLILTGSNRIITASGGRFASVVPDLPSAEMMRRARFTSLVAEFESDAPRAPSGEAAAGMAPPVRTDAGEPTLGSAAGLRLRIIAAIGATAQRPDDGRYLHLLQPVSRALSESAEAISQGRNDYQQLLESRVGLKRLFYVTLTLIFFLTAFASIAAAFLLSGWLTGPLSMLAAGTRAVAGGDFRPVKSYSGRDELGVLTESFNAMMRQLADARQQVDRNQRELKRANARLESVLANLTAGVLVLDSEFRLTLGNAGAERILNAGLGQHLGKAITEIPGLEQIAPQVEQAFHELALAGDASWQRQFAMKRMIPSAPADGGSSAGSVRLGPGLSPEQTILARGSILPERRVGYVIVFDDITEMVSAQRALAWADVARRLAHEIMNPLTPIQLATERLRAKLAGRLPPAEDKLLESSARTIIQQVSSLKQMVDEFRDYARLPSAVLAPLDLNELVEEVARLYAGPEVGAHLRLELDPELPLVMADSGQLRQVVHNLIKNSLEAIGKSEAAEVILSTATIESPAGARTVRLQVRDNGPGFASAVLGRIFEPYVTTKPRGTGLGLAIVRKIVEEHGARIDASNVGGEAGRGAQVSLHFTKLAKSGENS